MQINRVEYESRIPGYEALGFCAPSSSAFVVRADALQKCNWLPMYTRAPHLALGQELKLQEYLSHYISEPLAVGMCPALSPAALGPAALGPAALAALGSAALSPAALGSAALGSATLGSAALSPAALCPAALGLAALGPAALGSAALCLVALSAAALGLAALYFTVI